MSNNTILRVLNHASGLNENVIDVSLQFSIDFHMQDSMSVSKQSSLLSVDLPVLIEVNFVSQQDDWKAQDIGTRVGIQMPVGISSVYSCTATSGRQQLVLTGLLDPIKEASR